MSLNSKEMNMIHAAEMYYDQRLCQSEIAKELGCSCSTISRLLADAIEMGIVRINIKYPVYQYPELSKKVKLAFNLNEVIVVSGGESNEQAFYNVGFAAAEFLASLLRDDIVIGVSWGATLSYLVRELSEVDYEFNGIEVVQLMGGMGCGDPAIDGPELARKMAECLGGTFRYLPAPAVVETSLIAKYMLKEKHIQKTIERAFDAEITISSVGSLQHNLSSLERVGYIDKKDRISFQMKGAIGHSLSRMINENGEPIDDAFNERIIGAPIEVMRKAKWAIGIGANPLKSHVFVAAIKNRQFNMLVIDDGTAREMLRLNQAENDR